MIRGAQAPTIVDIALNLSQNILLARKIKKKFISESTAKAFVREQERKSEKLEEILEDIRNANKIKDVQQQSRAFKKIEDALKQL